MLEKNNYEWDFVNIGGVVRINIKSGEDIAHLSELDRKMWTVLSCPVKGLEIDEKTLGMIDSDNDDKIRIDEIISVAKWLTNVLKNTDALLKQSDTIALSEFNQETEEGKKLYNSAKQILINLGLKKDSISVADTLDSLAIFAKTKFNGDGVITEYSADDENLKNIIASCIKTIGSVVDRSGDVGITAEQIESFYNNCNDYLTWVSSVDVNDSAIFPYGDNTEKALNAYKVLKDKIDDYFVRCKLSAFNKEAIPVLDFSLERLGSISEKNLVTCLDEIATYPLSRVNTKRELELTEGINPAWEAAFAELKHLIFDVDFASQKSITETEWQTIASKFTLYENWKNSKKGELVESLGIETIKKILADNSKESLLNLIEQDKALESTANEINTVTKFMHLYRDFYMLLKNFVSFTDFYSKNNKTKAIFQAGTLFIDQRSCDLCMKVSDMAKHNTMAALSGMYLLYCDCFSKVKNEKMTIVAVMTNGDINNLIVGKNAVFYDRNGLDWDATVVKIIDNPISIRQAFWSPYRKFGNLITEQINKFASNQDKKVADEASAKINTTSTQIIEKPVAAEKPQAFDIAKFCGIFAAIGMAIGYIGGFLVSIATGFLNLKLWQMPLALVGVMILISGPSMIMAWMKLRNRNLSPILNANGWAINAPAFVNITLGSILTKVAAFPTLSVPNITKKNMPIWKKLLIVFLLLAVVVAGLYFTNILSFVGFPFREPVETVVDTTIVLDTVANAAKM